MVRHQQRIVQNVPWSSRRESMAPQRSYIFILLENDCLKLPQPEADTSHFEWLNWTELNWTELNHSLFFVQKYKSEIRLKLSSHQTLIEMSDCFTPGEGGTPNRYQDPVMWARLEIPSTAKRWRGGNSKTTHSMNVHSLTDELLIHGTNETKLKINWLSSLSCCHIFLSLCPERYHKSSRRGRFKSEHPQRKQNRFFNPSKVRQASLPFSRT